MRTKQNTQPEFIFQLPSAARITRDYFARYDFISDFLHQQALGSVTELTQPSGAVVEWVTYDVYGLPTILNQVGTTITQSAVGNPWLYTGREYDPESGLYFYRARTYDPGTGRFLQSDPLGFGDGLGSHEFVSSSPASFTDPSGMTKLMDAYLAWSNAAWALEVAQREQQAAQSDLDYVVSELGKLRALLSAIRQGLGPDQRMCGRSPIVDDLLKEIAELEEDLAGAKARLAAAVGAVEQAEEVYADAADDLQLLVSGSLPPHVGPFGEKHYSKILVMIEIEKRLTHGDKKMAGEQQLYTHSYEDVPGGAKELGVVVTDASGNLIDVGQPTGLSWNTVDGLGAWEYASRYETANGKYYDVWAFLVPAAYDSRHGYGLLDPDPGVRTENPPWKARVTIPGGKYLDEQTSKSYVYRVDWGEGRRRTTTGIGVHGARNGR